MMTAQKNLVRTGKRVALYPASKLAIKTPDRIAITMKNRIEIIEVKQILHLQAESNYTHIHLADGTHYLSCHTLKSFDQILHAPDFLRVHQSHIIQTRFLKSFNPMTCTAHLHCDLILPVSRARKSRLMEYLKALMI